MIKKIGLFKRIENFFKDCPLGHFCDSDCQNTKECFCNEHNHSQERFAQLLWKINHKLGYWFCVKYEIPF